MDSPRNARPAGSEFPRAAVLAMRDRFLRRVERHDASTKVQRPVSWSYAVIRNKAKLAPRLQQPVQPDARNTQWEHWLADQREKLWRMLDPYRRWMKRESYNLSELNDGKFNQHPVHARGSAWGYVADLQRQKLQITLLPGSPNDTRRLPGWSGVQSRARSRLMKGDDLLSQRDGWDYVIGGTQRKLRGTTSFEQDWRPCILRASRRNWNS